MVHNKHIGMQVVATDWDGEKDLRGMTGVLRTFTEDGTHALVEYPMNIKGNNGTDDQGNPVGKPGHCYWHPANYVALHGKASFTPKTKKIQRDFKHRGRNLKGKPFRFLGVLSSGVHAVVEFSEDVGGHSADGHGKRGQCLCVPVEVLKKEEAKAKPPHEVNRSKKAGKK